MKRAGPAQVFRDLHGKAWTQIRGITRDRGIQGTHVRNDSFHQRSRCATIFEKAAESGQAVCARGSGRTSFRPSVRIGNIDRNSSFYRFLLDICRLAPSAQMPDELIEQYRFRNFFRDEAKMALLFQHFVFNFLRRERKELRVFREQIQWQLDELSGGKRSLLPIMETDISVCCGTIRTIIDTKYYLQPLSNRFGSEKLHSSNFYQLFSYFQNASWDNTPVHGMLLYAQVGRSFKERFSIRGSCLTLVTSGSLQFGKTSGLF